MTGLELTRFAGRTTFRLSRPPVSGVLRLRVLAVSGLIAAGVFVVFCVGIAIGDYPVALIDVIRALGGSGDRFALLTVRELRLPRELVGLLVGGAFGMSGALCQTITRNPLASPDMIGITAGATTAVVAGIVFDIGVGSQTLGLAGGLLTALTIYLLAWRRGTTGYRIILVGIGVSWICISATSYLLARAQLHQAQEATGWLVGSVNDRTWHHVGPIGLAMAVLVPVALIFGRWLRTLALGDEVAVGLGTPVQRARLILLLVGVGLVSFGTAAAGPIAFVALAAPQIAQRLVGLAAPPLVASALTGALVVLGGDLIARLLFPDSQLPVGVITGVLGAPFLLWLLMKANRAGSGG